MFNALRSRGFASLMMIAGMTSTAWAEGTIYQNDQHIMVRSGSKGERRCVIISAIKRPDGVVEYRVKAIDNGEVMTILDRSSSSVARSKPIENEAPKLSVSSDPLLASSLRQPAPATAQTPDFPVPPADAMAARLQPRTTAQTETSRSQPATVVSREPTARQTISNLSPGKAVVGDGSDPIPANLGRTISPSERVAAVGSDPVPLKQVHFVRDAVPMTDPISMGFAIPVASSHQTSMPAKRQFEREERIVTLGETLKNALQPMVRLNAAEALTEIVEADSTAVRSLLISAAENDPAAIVRATCIRSLVKIGVRDKQFQTLLESAKKDPDARVRIEVDLAEDSRR